MKFKKGDLVEVIEKDEYCGYIFPKGSRWTVYSDQIDDNIIRVCDGRHDLNYSILWADCVKKVDHTHKKPRFKIGDMVKVKTSTYCNDNSIGKFYRVENVTTNSLGDHGFVRLYTGVNGDYTKTWPYRFYEVELVDVNKCDQMELYELIQQCESLRNSNKKSESLNSALKNNNRILSKYNSQLNEENKDLKYQIKFLEGELRHKAARLKNLKNEKLTYAQRVSELIEENKILKENLERKKFFKNLLTKNKD